MERLLAAYHEAGHALIYHLLGMEMRSIFCTKEGNGSVIADMVRPTAVFDPAAPEKLYARMEKYGMLCYAGFCSEFKISGRRLRGLLIAPDPDTPNDIVDLNQEMQRANMLLGRNSYGEFFQFMTQVDTRRLIGRKAAWAAITDLSESLLKSHDGKIWGPEAHTILSKHFPFGKYLY